jgi:hypothetical protein
MMYKSEAADLVLSAIAKAERSKRWTCDKAGFSPSTFQRKIAGGADFTLGELARIAHALSIPVTDLLPDDFKVSR